MCFESEILIILDNKTMDNKAVISWGNAGEGGLGSFEAVIFPLESMLPFYFGAEHLLRRNCGELMHYGYTAYFYRKCKSDIIG